MEITRRQLLGGVATLGLGAYLVKRAGSSQPIDLSHEEIVALRQILGEGLEAYAAIDTSAQPLATDLMGVIDDVILARGKAKEYVDLSRPQAHLTRNSYDRSFSENPNVYEAK